jgi:hypothetical protein
MEHHRCYPVFITKTRSTRVSDTVAFQHQYITNPTISPESHVVVAAQQLATALKGNIPAGNKTAEALTKVSALFARIAETKLKVTAAKEQQNKLRTYPMVRQTTESPPALVTAPSPRVTANPQTQVPRVAASP